MAETGALADVQDKKKHIEAGKWRASFQATKTNSISGLDMRLLGQMDGWTEKQKRTKRYVPAPPLPGGVKWIDEYVSIGG